MGEPYILRHCPKRKGLVRVPYIPELGGFPDCTCNPNANIPPCESPKRETKKETTAELIARTNRLLNSPYIKEAVEKSKTTQKTSKQNVPFVLNKQ